jgi:hypothetical protein
MPRSSTWASVVWRCRESNPGPPLLSEGFSVRSPLCLYSDPPVMRASRCDDPSRCVVFPSTPRPGGRVSPLADAGFRGGDTPGPTAFELAQAARANALRLLAAVILLRRVVNEIIVAFLGTLPLDPLPESKPFTPLHRPCGGRSRVTLPRPGIISGGGSRVRRTRAGRRSGRSRPGSPRSCPCPAPSAAPRPSRRCSRRSRGCRRRGGRSCRRSSRPAGPGSG